jgi:hypothetical protein
MKEGSESCSCSIKLRFNEIGQWELFLFKKAPVQWKRALWVVHVQESPFQWNRAVRVVLVQESSGSMKEDTMSCSCSVKLRFNERGQWELFLSRKALFQRKWALWVVLIQESFVSIKDGTESCSCPGKLYFKENEHYELFLSRKASFQ